MPQRARRAGRLVSDGGTVFKVSASYGGQRIAAATTERYFYYMNADGRILWRAMLPDDVCRVVCEPLGSAVVCGFQSGRIVRLEWRTGNDSCPHAAGTRITFPPLFQIRYRRSVRDVPFG